MSVILISKSTFNQVQIDNVSNIAFSSGIYSITFGSPAQTVTYAAANYNIQILFKEV